MAWDTSPKDYLSPSSAYEDNRQMSGYEDQGDDHAAYEDGSHNDPDPFGTAWRAPITQQPRGTVGLRLGPEPEVVNAIEVNRARSRDITLREASREAVQAVHENGGAADEAFDEGAFVKGRPLSRKLRLVAELSALAFLAMAIVAIVHNNIFDGMFFGSVTSTTLAMELSLRATSPPSLPGNFCGGHGPNNRPAAWFLTGVLFLWVTNIVAWAMHQHDHLKAYGVSFLLWTTFDLFLLVVAHEWKAMGVDALAVFLMFLFNVMFQYEGYKYNEETFIAFCCLVVAVHLPVNVLQITYHDDCNEALRARFLPRPPANDEDEDDPLIEPAGSPLGFGRKPSGYRSPGTAYAGDM